MAVESFLIDAPHVVPSEFAAWEAAKQRHRELFLQVLALDPKGTSDRVLEGAAIKAAAEADRLEQVARQVWARALTS
jgi:hypothetical protein